MDDAARLQMETALRLPVAAGGALMADAHVGYGLPIGGVLAVREAVIPWAVGLDIACRLRLSVFELSSHVLGQKKLRRIHAGLATPESGVSPAEAEWIVQRLAELLGWPGPEPVAADD